MVRGLAFPIVVAVACAACLPPQRPAPVGPATDDTATILAEGTTAPDVAALGAAGKPVRVSDFRGKLLVLYFYPVDFASGATAQANEFGADLARYQKAGAAIVGVSTDDLSSHRDFAEKHKIKFALLSDAGGGMARAFGVPLTGGTATHVTFLIDREGVVRRVWKKVRPWGHSAEVLAAVREVGRK